MTYCEQALAIHNFEPLNAWSNVGFVAAALSAYRDARQHQIPMQSECGALIILAIAIACGSFAWHATHAPWAELADVLPILAFVLLFLFTALRQLGVLRGVPMLATTLLALTIVGITLGWPEMLNGSAAYLPVLVSLGVLAYIAREAQRLLGTAAVIFGLSLILRTVDLEVCAVWPQGTHWLWHCLNSVVIYLALRGALVIRSYRPR